MKKQIFRKIVFRFRKFIHKGYAAFCSMHKVVNLGCVSTGICDKELLKSGKSVALCSILLYATGLYGMEVSETEDPLTQTQLAIEEVSVVAERSEFQSDIFRLVTNISSAEIAALPINNVADLLQYLPGIDLRERGSSGVQADLSMRGGTQDQIKILLNGVDLTDPQTGHYSMDLPLDVNLIERVEVMQGTNYGLGAFSGAINIITRKGTDNGKTAEVTGSLAAGEYGLVNPSLSGRFRKGEWYLNSGISYNRSSGYAANTDYKIANGYVQTGWRGLDFQIGVQMKDAGANSFYSLAYPNQFDATRTLFSTLSYSHRWGDWGLNGNVYYRAHFDHYELYRESKDADGMPAPDWYKGANNHWTHTSGARLSGSWSQWWGKTSIGIDLRDEYISSSNLGIHNRLNLNYFAEQNVYINGFSGSIGASGTWNSNFGSDYSLGANLGYEIRKDLRVFLNFNRAIRIPTFTDLYYESATQLSNPDLKPEKALQMELGIKYAGTHWYANASGYYRYGRDIIDWVKEPVDSIVQWYAVNYTRVNAAGAEVNVGVQEYEYIHKIELSYSFCDVSKDAGDMLSKYALDYLRHKVSLRIDHKIWKGLGAAWCLRFQQREGTYSDRTGVICHYAPVFLLDGKVYWANEHVRVAVECQNMTNQIYYDYGGILQPQHWVQAKVDWKFRYK
ncbi:MAG: TonB-dependent receptor [Paludibacter sp.]|nr:TonB-dependent receptor [Bacteroidales bacterium]MCM1068376.1 TonB-dependent receptor [Prevotella sp.]MCM1354525.1 TonB-dependent receptor [Bacteroides sp.]MCM1443442.1 TonB-dependent receptor [Muribaculum sp.]MCM1482657.1 TonB-dependent receptor [Paludibacter sp.]